MTDNCSGSGLVGGEWRVATSGMALERKKIGWTELAVSGEVATRVATSGGMGGTMVATSGGMGGTMVATSGVRW